MTLGEMKANQIAFNSRGMKVQTLETFPNMKITLYMVSWINSLYGTDFLFCKPW